MSAPTIEDRVSQLETEMNKVKGELATRRKNPWATFGLMAGSKHYDSIVRLGAEYRQRQRDDELDQPASDPNHDAA